MTSKKIKIEQGSARVFFTPPTQKVGVFLRKTLKNRIGVFFEVFFFVGRIGVFLPPPTKKIADSAQFKKNIVRVGWMLGSNHPTQVFLKGFVPS